MKRTTILAVLAGLLCVACDPIYSISVSNQTTDTVSVLATTTHSFHIYQEPLDFEERGGIEGPFVVQFRIAPGQTVQCGQAIAELEDDLPFKEFKASWGTESVVANSKAQVLDLFDKNFWGDLKTPYQISLK